MDDAMHATLAGWGNFYLLTGTAAAALTGLQFVVQTLIASEPMRPLAGDPEAGISAFGSPTVVHFTLALLVSAVLSAPWPDGWSLRAMLGVLGAGALAYATVVLRRARRQRSYVPVAEDWIWHIALPSLAYATILVADVLLGRGAVGPLFALAAATLLLLCIGIHNAWDTVTYLAIGAVRADPGSESAPSQRGPRQTRRRRRR